MSTGDRGVGMVPTAAGFVVFILFLLLAVQVLYGLYATSTVRGVLNDAASRAANGLASEAELARLADPALREAVLRGVREAGYDEVEIDPQGYRRGRLNETLPGRAIRVTGLSSAVSHG